MILAYTPAMPRSRFDEWARAIGTIGILLPLYFVAAAIAFYGAVWLFVNVGGWSVLAIIGLVCAAIWVMVRMTPRKPRWRQ